MKRITCLLILWISIGFVTMCSMASSAAKQVNLITIASYFPKEILVQFEKETGIHINKREYSSDDVLAAKLLMGHTGYDVVVSTASYVQREILAGVFQALPIAQFKNYKNIDPVYYEKAGLPKNKVFGIVQTIGTTGIATNANLVRLRLGQEVKLDDLGLVLNPKSAEKLADCGLSILNDPVEVFGMVLKYMGKNPNSRNLKDYDDAKEVLMKVRPYLTYVSSNRYLYDLASGDLCAAIAYSGDASRARMFAKQSHSGADIHYEIPETGASVWYDMLTVPKDAPHPKEAMQLIDFLMRPKVSAAFSNFSLYPSSNKAAKPYYSGEIKTKMDQVEGPMVSKLFFIQMPTDAVMKKINDLWFEVQYGIKVE